MALIITEDDLNNPEVLGSKLMNLSEIVIAKHFYASRYMLEDLRSIGVLKALEVISKGYFDASKGNLTSFLYSQIRNQIHNTLYHENKNPSLDIESLIDCGVNDEYFKKDTVDMSYSLIHTVCMNFTTSFGNNIENLVIERLIELGYTVIGRKNVNNVNPVYIYCYDPIKEEFGEQAEEEIVSRIVGLILWKAKDNK